MSLICIVVGLLIAGLILAVEFVACRDFDFSQKWMVGVLIALVGLAASLLREIQTRKALSPFWERACMGIRWRRRFPDARAAQLREFLNIFVDAFVFPRKRRCCFSPDDRIMAIYRALYPPGSMADSMELEFLCLKLRERYGIDLTTSRREDITLGEIYALCRLSTAR
jgi:propanediol dehydratase small subunit